MARIRTIKPEFWSSEQVMECSPLARLLFIGLWNFCDDGGNHPLSEKTIKALVFPGDSMDSTSIRRILVELSSNDLLRLYECSGKLYLNVRGWKHQKIDRPTMKYPGFDEGMEVFPDVIWPGDHVVDESSTIIRRVIDEPSPPEGIGNGKGRDREEDQKRSSDLALLDSPAPAKPARTKPKTENQQANADTWQAYADAYFNRYGTEPVRNASVNSQIANLVKRVGAESAPGIAAYYVGMNRAFYVQKLHPVGLLLSDCESIHTQWATNRQVTDTRARQIDQTQSNMSVADEAYELFMQTQRGGDHA